MWSAHRSEAFRTWLSNHYPSIPTHFVPGGCTGVLQAFDVGIQRILKHSTKCSYHEDAVNGMLSQLDDGLETLETSTKIKALKNQSVTWLWRASIP